MTYLKNAVKFFRERNPLGIDNCIFTDSEEEFEGFAELAEELKGELKTFDAEWALYPAGEGLHDAAELLLCCLGIGFPDAAMKDTGAFLEQLSFRFSVELRSIELCAGAKTPATFGQVASSPFNSFIIQAKEYSERLNEVVEFYRIHKGQSGPYAVCTKAAAFLYLVLEQNRFQQLSIDLGRSVAEASYSLDVASDAQVIEKLLEVGALGLLLPPVLSGLRTTCFQEMAAENPAAEPKKATQKGCMTRKARARRRGRKRAVRPAPQKKGVPPPVPKQTLDVAEPKSKLSELLPVAEVPRVSVPPPVDERDFLARVTPRGLKEAAYPELFRLHSKRLEQLSAWLRERKTLPTSSLTIKQRKFLLFQQIARCQELIESSLVRSLAQNSLMHEGERHVLDATPDGMNRPLCKQHSLCLYAAILSSHPAYQTIISEHRTLLETLDAAHTLVFYWEGSGHFQAPRSSRTLAGILEALSRVNDENEFKSSQGELESYVEETLLFVGKLLSANIERSEASLSEEVANLLNISSPEPLEMAVPATPPAAPESEEKKEVEEVFTTGVTNTKQGLARLASCKPLLASIRPRPVEMGHQAKQRRSRRNETLAQVGRYVEWLEAALEAGDFLNEQPLSLTLPAVDALHRAIKQSVVAAVYQRSIYVEGKHRVSCPTQDGHPRLLRVDNDVCATYRVLSAALPEKERSMAPTDFERRLGWLSGVHDRLGYPDRKRGEERGVYELISRIQRLGRELQVVAASDEWSQVKEGKSLNPEQIRSDLSKDTAQLLEAVIYPGIDALYQLLRNSFCWAGSLD